MSKRLGSLTARAASTTGSRLRGTGRKTRGRGGLGYRHGIDVAGGEEADTDDTAEIRSHLDGRITRRHFPAWCAEEITLAIGAGYRHAVVTILR